jgi:hypothetical protein
MDCLHGVVEIPTHVLDACGVIIRYINYVLNTKIHIKYVFKCVIKTGKLR